MVLITNMAGKVAGQEAFPVKTPKNAKKTLFPYLTNYWSCELLLPLILCAMAMFYCDLVILNIIGQNKPPKNAKNRLKDGFTNFINLWSY